MQVSRENTMAEQNVHVVKPHNFQGYLDFEANEVEKSKQMWQPEFVKFCALADKYLILTSGMKIDNSQVRLPARLLLEVESQMYSIGSQLLRRRVTDAMVGLRRAIEATGVAYRVWKNPSLAEVFFNAYPWAEQQDHPKQWKTSEDYRREFNSGKLFGEEGEVWNSLKIGYQVLSAMASHAGPGALSGQEIQEGYYFSHFVETNDKEIRRSWYYSISMLWAILRVFFTILRQSIPVHVAGSLEADVISWRNSIESQMRERAPWMDRTDGPPSPLGLILTPHQIGFLLSEPVIRSN